MICVENNQECFVVLWRKLERTRRLLGGQYKRYCIRNVLKSWFGSEATDDFIWEVCQALVDDEPQEGWNELPLPSLYPRKAPRTLASHRGRPSGHQLLQDRPESPRRGLQHRIP